MVVTQDDYDKANGMVLIKSDGSPSYNFASIVDDLTMDINLIIRGVDHITNTSRQVILADVLNQDTGTDMDFVLPKFAHIGLIYFNKKKLSKRDGAASMLYYRDAGYDPDAMLNFMVRLGWGPTVDDKTTAMLPRDKMIDLFLAGGKMRNTPANMDVDKLNSFDRKYKAMKKKMGV